MGRNIPIDKYGPRAYDSRQSWPGRDERRGGFKYLPVHRVSEKRRMNAALTYSKTERRNTKQARPPCVV